MHQLKCLCRTIFYNDASKNIYTYNHVSLGVHENIASMSKMEEEAIFKGIQVKCYYYNNGVYTSDYLTNALNIKGNGIIPSGVGEHN